MNTVEKTSLQKTGRWSIVVRPHLRELFNEEKNKNKLINELLEIRYKQSKVK